MIKEELGSYTASELKDIIEGDVNNYNERISEIKFDTPTDIVIGCIYNGHFCFLFFENENVNVKFLLSPEEKLQEIINFNKEKILNQKQEKVEKIEKLKLELKEMIAKDPEFLLCTNKRLRMQYIKELLNSLDEEQFGELKKYWISRSFRGVYQEAIDFVEFIWKKIKD